MSLHFPMRFNKAKALRSAEKSLSQGKVQAAIGEYRRIIEQEPNDWTALNMLGDLHVRAGQPDDAIDLFTRVAEHYRSQGFALKAIAMYKKMLRLRPDDLAASSVLADLYAAQGLIVEARAQLLSIADAHTARNHAHAALEILRRIADLDPHNPEVRLRVASAYAREGFATEAAAAYTEAGERFLDRAAPEQALEAFTEALSLAPVNTRALAGALGAHTRLGTPDDAAELLEAAASREDVEPSVVELLLRAYTETGDASAALRVVERLVHIRDADAASRALHIDVARLHLRAGDETGATRSLESALDGALALKRDAEVLEILDEITRRNPENLPALRAFARVYAFQHDEAMLAGTCERIVEVARLAGDEAAETDALQRLVELAPDSADAHRARLHELGAPVAARETHAPATNEVPTFESFMLSDAASQHAQPERVTIDEPAYGEVSFADVAGEQTADFEMLAPEESADTSTPAPVVDPGSSFADLNDADALPIAAYEDSAHEEAHEVALDASPRTPAPRVAEDDDRIGALLSRELESVDFYIAQDYKDVARDTLDMLERQYGAHGEIDARRLQLTSGASPATVRAADDPGAETQGFGEVDLGGALESSAPVDFGARADEQPEVRSDARADAGNLRAADFDVTGFDSVAATPPAAQIVAEPESAGNETLIENPFDDFVIDEAAPRPADAVPPAPSAGSFDAGLAAIFDEFRTAVEDETPVSVADYETHYNLGIAYQEMGLLDESVEEFQKAAGIAAPADGTPRYLQCCNMLGHCFLQKNLPQIAVMWFRRGLDAPDHTEDEYQALRYELGNAYQAAGEHDRALKTFMEVYGIDVSYRGVAVKLRELQTAVAS